MAVNIVLFSRRTHEITRTFYKRFLTLPLRLERKEGLSPFSS